jgi:cytochrome b6-f complex iron-sulfur subunit
VGCGGDGPSDAGPAIDAPPHFTPCGTNEICIDVSLAQNQPLSSVGGWIRFDIPSGDTLIVIRQSTTAVVTLSDVCTHQGCLVAYNASAGNLQCPCHGSQFSVVGTVLRGPAVNPLHAYATTYDSATDTITIALA